MPHDESAPDDVESLKRRIEALAREAAENRRDAERWRALMKARVVSLALYDGEGFPTQLNPGSEALWHVPASTMLENGYNLRKDPQLEELGVKPFIERLFAGEEVLIPPVSYDAHRLDEQGGLHHWICAFGVPAARGADGGVEEAMLLQCAVPQGAAIQRNYEALLAEQQLLQASLEERNRALTEQVRLIAAQHEAIQALSVPVIRIWDGVLCLPIVGTLEDARASRLLERLLEAITTQQATEVLIDITGLPALDAEAASHLLKAAAAARLLGARCALVGVSPAIARTLVELGVDLGTLITAATLAEGLAGALARLQAAGKRPRK
jgi:rsbT co-antagonist protein RsbR